MLVQEEVGIQYSIYDSSKALLNANTKYPIIEKWALALVIEAKKLRPYFQAFLIVMMD